MSKLDGVPWEKRSARFRCVIAVATPDGAVETCSGECRGIITFEPRGEQGFGYDPIFFVPNLKKTVAQLTREEKNAISHRGSAIRKLKPLLAQLLKNSEVECDKNSNN